MGVVKWVETKAGLMRSEYMKIRYDGIEREEIRKSFFKGDVRLFRDQLIEWELLSLDDEWEELKIMGKVAKKIDLTKEQYLQRRLAGETRSKVLNSLGVAKPRAYELLKEWGIRELDAEERELGLLANNNGEKASAKQLQVTAGEDILRRMEQRAAAQEQELANLKAAVELWKNDAMRKGEHITNLEAEISRFSQQSS